jgi:hypothetical protein
VGRIKYSKTKKTKDNFKTTSVALAVHLILAMPGINVPGI